MLIDLNHDDGSLHWIYTVIYALQRPHTEQKAHSTINLKSHSQSQNVHPSAVHTTSPEDTPSSHQASEATRGLTLAGIHTASVLTLFGTVRYSRRLTENDSDDSQ